MQSYYLAEPPSTTGCRCFMAAFVWWFVPLCVTVKAGFQVQVVLQSSSQQRPFRKGASFAGRVGNNDIFPGKTQGELLWAGHADTDMVQMELYQIQSKIFTVFQPCEWVVVRAELPRLCALCQLAAILWKWKNLLGAQVLLRGETHPGPGLAAAVF